MIPHKPKEMPASITLNVEGAEDLTVREVADSLAGIKAKVKPSAQGTPNAPSEITVSIENDEDLTVKKPPEFVCGQQNAST